MAPQKGEYGKKKGKVRKNTVKVHKDVQECSTDETCGALERKNARNSITKVVSLSISKVILLLVLEIQEDMGRSGMVLGNYLGMCKIVSPRWYVSVARCMACRACGQHKGTTRECKKRIRAGGPVVWVEDMRCEGVGWRQNARTQECKKCAKVEEILYLYGVKMYRGGEKDGNIGGKWRMFP